jgi:hypothetical protein
MDNSISIKQFKEARVYMEKLVTSTLETMDIGIYDPWLKHIFEKELIEMINNQFKDKYPDITIYFNFTIYISDQTIEYSVQNYFHPFSQHKYLGSLRNSQKKDGRSDIVDCYYSNLYESFGEARIILRNGHIKKQMTEAGGSAAEQYYRGLDTMMARGYQLALEYGYVKEG